MRQQIFSEVDAERAYQERKWGNAFDDRNTPYHWSVFIAQYSTRNLIGDQVKVNSEKFRADMVKVAALAVAAIEAHDRAKP